ncbi:UNVERIFIED_CONTAM: hypothetical protein Slati_1509500 [Sesamum latifolium]|uniref:Reverse transcriptase n=1 Tax=Sesamum latifolium TaxID=2727402 RepID=A0AAW2XBF5_9LAMI
MGIILLNAFSLRNHLLSELVRGERQGRLTDLCYLRPWVKHILSEEEALLLVLPVTPEEVKQAVFTIDEVKAPGPDGYSSGFFKSCMADYCRGAPPPRCSLKVDIRKACDTVEWDFLSAVLKLFGFLEQFILWIEDNLLPKQEVSHFTGGVRSYICCILVLRTIFSYSAGRTRPRCIFSNKDSQSLLTSWDSTSTFRRAISSYLGQQLLIGTHCSPSWTFEKGSFPSILGTPPLGFMIVYADCKPILLKIDSLIKGWDGIMLSFAGRVQLIKSVLTALQVYWAMAFILLKTIIREIEKRLRSFFWKGCTGVGYAKVSWKQVCRPVTEGV